MKHACLVLPFPPSLNSIIKCWRNQRVKTAAHRDYLGEAVKALKQQPCPTFSGPVSVSASLGRPDRRKRDIDNHWKAAGDALVTAGILEDDSLIHRLTLQWADDVTGVRVEIEDLERRVKAAGEIA